MSRRDLQRSPAGIAALLNAVFLIVGVTATGGCWFVTPPLDPDTIITCTSTDDCPSTHICVAETRCAPRDSADTDAPAVVRLKIDAPAGQTPAAPGGSIDFTVTFDEAIGEDAFFEVLLPSASGTPAVDGAIEEVDDARLSFRVTATLPLDAGSGAAELRGSVRDAFGNRLVSGLLGGFQIDADPPQLSSSRVVIVPGDGNLNLSPTALTDGSSAEVVVVFSEIVDVEQPATMLAVPAASADGVDACEGDAGAVVLDGGHGEIVGEFRLTVSAQIPSGHYALLLCPADAVGNRGSVRLPDTLVVERDPPTLSVDQTQVVVVRAERGNDVEEARGQLVIPAGRRVALTPPDTLDGDAIAGDTFVLGDGTVPRRLLVWGDNARQLLLANISPIGAGASASPADATWPRTTMSLNAEATVYLSGLDAAGNESALVALDSAVRVMVPGTSAAGPSPHGVFLGASNGALGNAAPAASDDGVTDASNGAQAAGLGDGLAIRHATTSSWVKRSGSHLSVNTPETQPFNTAGAGFASDAARARVVAVVSGETDVYEWDGERWHGVTPAGESPLPVPQATLAYDEGLGKTVLITRTGTWTWDGRRLQLLTAASPSPAEGTAVYHPAYEAVLFMPRLRTGEIHAFKEGRWSLLRDDGPVGELFTMAVDEGTGQILVFGGTRDRLQGLAETWTLDGDAWTVHTDVNAPVDAAHGTLVYAPSLGETLLIAPTRLLGGAFTASNEVFAWDGASWRDTSAALPFPVGMFVPAAFDHASQQVVAGPGVAQMAFGAGAYAQLTFQLGPDTDAPLHAYAPTASAWTRADGEVPVTQPFGAIGAFDPLRRKYVTVGVDPSFGFATVIELDLDTEVIERFEPPPPGTVCGDGLRLGSEQCDDGNLVDGDGCDEVCALEGAETLLFEDVESGAPGWQTEVLSGSAPWTIDDGASTSPTHAWFSGDAAAGPKVVRLTSPPFALSAPPTGVLQFEHLWDHAGCETTPGAPLPEGHAVELLGPSGPSPVFLPDDERMDGLQAGGDWIVGWGGDSGGMFESVTVGLDELVIEPGVHQLRVTYVATDHGCAPGQGAFVDDVRVIAVPTTPCGDGLLGRGEQCDDGNTTAGDGCDPLCQLEDATVVYSEDFETGAPAWSVEVLAGAGAGWGASTTHAASPGTSWHAPLNAPTLSSARLVSPVFSVPSTGASVLQFDHLLDINACGDGGWIEIADVSGPFPEFFPFPPNGGFPDFLPWIGTEGWSGDSALSFVRETVDLSFFAGADVQLGFVTAFGGAPCPESGDGWFVDDVVLLNAAGPPLCGNGMLDPGELCDDGGTTSGDGCDADCAFEDAEVLFFDAADEGATAMVPLDVSGMHSWSVSEAEATSPPSAWHSGDAQQVDVLSVLASPPFFVGPGQTMLRFNQRWEHDDCGIPQPGDGHNIHVRVDGGGPILVEPIGGYPGAMLVQGGVLPGYDQSSNGEWVTTTADLSGFQGAMVSLEFVVSFDDQSCAPAAGWFIDDIEVLRAELGDGGPETPEGPGARSGASMAYSAEAQGVILFGGVNNQFGSGSVSTGTWLWDGASWTDLCADGCATPPPPRVEAGMTADPVTGGIILHGGLEPFDTGSGPQSLGDTWRFAQGVWTEIGDPDAPFPLAAPALAYDTEHDHLVALGGLNLSGTAASIIIRAVFEDGEWTPTELDPTGFGASYQQGAVFHPGLGQTLVFGGRDGAFLHQATALIEPGSSHYALVSAGGRRPPARAFGKLWFDAPTGDVHLVSGLIAANDSPPQPASDHWVLTSAESRAVALFRFDLPGEGITRHSVNSLRVRGAAAGTADTGDGFVVRVFDGRDFITVYEGDAGPVGDVVADGDGRFDVELPAELLPPTETISVEVGTLPGGSGSLLAPAVVAVDYLELRVGHLPARKLAVDEPCVVGQTGRPCGDGLGCHLTDGSFACRPEVLLELGDSCTLGDDSAVCDPEQALACDGVACVSALDGESPLWTCEASTFASGGACDCGCGSVDPDCAGSARSACQVCSGAGSCVAPEGTTADDPLGCRFIDEDDSGQCEVP